jgi:hypothetical protein
MKERTLQREDECRLNTLRNLCGLAVYRIPQGGSQSAPKDAIPREPARLHECDFGIEADHLHA